MAMIAQAQQATIYISQRSTPTLGPWQANTNSNTWPAEPTTTKTGWQTSQQFTDKGSYRQQTWDNHHPLQHRAGGSSSARPHASNSTSKRSLHNEVLQAIKDHWIAVWSQAKDIGGRTLLEKWNFLQEDLPRVPLFAIQERPTLQHLISVAAAMKGSAGPDQWMAEEIKHIPFHALVVFWKLTARLEQAGQAPRILKSIRQVNC